MSINPSGKGRYQEVANLLKGRREELRLSRRDVVDATQLSYPYVAQLEGGYRAPSIAAARKLAAALHLRTEVLLALLGQPASDDVAAASSRTDDGFYANPAYADSTVRAPVGVQAAMTGPAPPVTSPGDEDAFGAAVESALTALAALPVDQRLEALGRVQARLMTDLVQAQVRRATEAGG